MYKKKKKKKEFVKNNKIKNDLKFPFIIHYMKGIFMEVMKKL